MNKIPKTRIYLSVPAVNAILSALEEGNSKLLEHKAELQKVLGTALFKLNEGYTKPAYLANELTLEDKVKKGLATPEEEAEYMNKLMESI